jgi:hypothetical protein
LIRIAAISRSCSIARAILATGHAMVRRVRRLSMSAARYRTHEAAACNFAQFQVEASKHGTSGISSPI